MTGLRFIWMSELFFLLLDGCEVDWRILLTVIDNSAEAKPLVYEHAAAVKKLNK